MKILKSRHNIETTDVVKIKEIPLGYINNEELAHDVSIEYGERFKTSAKKIVWPFQTFPTESPYLFDEDGKLIKDIELNRNGSMYRYEPKGTVEYSPLMFSARATVKRQGSFRSNIEYNLKVCVGERGEGIELSKRLISVFGTAARRGQCPVNVHINDDSMIPQSLLSYPVNECDFIFLESTDGIESKEFDTGIGIDYDGLLDNHTNVFVFVDSFNELLKKTERENSIIYADQGDPMTESLLFSDKKYYVDKDNYYCFNTELEHPVFKKDKYTYRSPHPAVLILEKEHKGHIVIMPKAILDNLYDNTGLIYEAMMNVYLNSYVTTDWVSSWITEEPVDYINDSATKFNKRHETINLTRMLNGLVDNLVDKSGYVLDSVETDTNNVSFIGISKNKDLSFMKVNQLNDIKKSTDETSYLTSKKTVINYMKSNLWQINTPANVEYNITEDRVYVTLKPFVNYQYGVCLTEDTTFLIPDNNNKYVISVKKSTPGITNKVLLTDMDEYEERTDGAAIAYITIRSNKASRVYDVRIAGGGIPKTAPDDYEMIDIGHPYGRPYRVGSTIVIKLPAAYKNHEDIIMAEIKKHVCAGDYPILVFNEV